MALHHLVARRSWVLRGVIHGFSEEARTRGIASLTLVRFAFVDSDILAGGENQSILGCT
jgi:hypothetical protein